MKAGQRRSWLLHRLDPTSGLPLVTAAVRLPGQGDEAAIRAALARRAAAHPALRTAFIAGADGEPRAEVGEVAGAAEVPLEVVRAADRAELVAAVATEARRQAERPFDLAKAPLLRAVVVRAGDGAALLLVGHAIALDARSLEHIALEVAGGAPPAPTSQRPSALANPEVSSRTLDAPADVVTRLRQALAGAEPLELPADRVRPAVPSHRAGHLVRDVPAEVARAVEQVAAASGQPREAVWLTALATVIGRYTRQHALVFGLGHDGPPAPADAIGAHGDALPLALSFAGDPTVREACARSAAALAEAARGRSVSLAELIEALQPARDPGRAPLFQALFRWRERPAGSPLLDAPGPATAFDVELEVEHAPDRTRLRLRWADDLFDAERMARLRDHLDVLLRGMSAALANDAPLASLPILTERERQAELADWNPRRAFSAREPLHRLVEAQARQTPDAVAVTYPRSENEGGDKAGPAPRQLTYAELLRQACKLARVLRRHGVGRDVRVAVCMPRSAEFVVALLAVLEAGGAYVPIEPSNPRDRIEFVVGDSEARVLLTHSAVAASLAGIGLPTVLVDDEVALAGESDAPLEDPTTSEARPLGGSHMDAAAYVIFTSGSTGRPKGVLVEHRNVVRLFEATEHWFHFGPSDVWTMFHSVGFDFSVWEIWGALVYGGRVVVVPHLVTRSPEDYVRLCADEGVTVLNQTPSAFRNFIQAEAGLDVGHRLRLRTVIFGGEALELESLRTWFARFGDQQPRLVNMYGITETTVHVTYRPIGLGDLDPADGSPSASVIGVPIPDLAVYVVDAGMQLCPVGVPGELVVAGAGVARGYLNRAELTAEKFVPDVLTPDAPATARLYRSGDLAARRNDGDLHYLGRIDQQVKIRGFRIETGEIEAVVRRATGVRDVAVLAHKRGNGEVLLVAYVVGDASVEALRETARGRLPEYMVPGVFVPVPVIPMTQNGKVDRRALPSPDEHRAASSGTRVPPSTNLERRIAAVWREVLGMAEVGVEDGFFDLGGTSLGVVKLAGGLRAAGIDVPVVKLFQFTTIAALAGHLEGAGAPAKAAAQPATSRARGIGDDVAVAIIGMAGRFPGANDVEALWEVLRQGRDTIRTFTPGELDPSIDPALVADPTYVRARGVLEGADQFDAGFFAMSPREAEVTDPQQRVLLEVAWEALEHAGHDPARFAGEIGVWAGEYNDSYYTQNVLRRPDVVEKVGAFQAMVGNEKDFVATRIAHRLDLTGPALSVHTACSTALVALSEAYWSLRTGQCDMALAGGAAVTSPQHSGYLYAEGGMLSADGHTRTFDAQASGTVFSDGAAMVVLRRLDDALAAGDRIWAIVRGAATNNDGGVKMSFSAPSVDGQAKVIAKAQAVAGVEPDSISYIEAHGTATPLGDPIEVEGLTQAFAQRTSRTGFCGIGSIKSNFGHLTAPSGAAGIIKTAFALDRELIPATVHFHSPNPKIDFGRTPFFVVDKASPWPRSGTPRRAGVSSFGVGGTNAHVILEEAPLPAPRPAALRPWQLFPVSARSAPALENASRRLADALERGTADLDDVAFTLQSGRRAFAERRFVVAADAAAAVTALRKTATTGTAGRARERKPPVVFVFPGQGSQYLGMGRGLAAHEPRFAATVARCCEMLRTQLGRDLREVIWPEAGDAEAASELLKQTHYTQPALFTIEYALADLWRSRGVEPETMLGHSVGEFVAACMAGVFSLEDALGLVALRGQMMQNQPRGSMLSVRLPAREVEPRLRPPLGIAAVNAPNLCVVAGPDEAIDAFAKELEAAGTACSRLHTSHAFHSSMMDPIVAPFEQRVRAVKLSKPARPFVSTVTALPITDAEATDPGYWARHLRATVRFADAVAEIWKAPERVLLEVGPRTTAATLARQVASDPKKQLAISTLEAAPEAAAENMALLRAAGQLWVAGVNVDLAALHDGGERRPRRVPLPTYPFEHKRYWIDPPSAGAAVPAPSPAPAVSAPAAEPVSPPVSSTNGTSLVAAAPYAAPPIAAAPVPMPSGSAAAASPHRTVEEPTMTAGPDRRERIIARIRTVFEEASGIDLADAEPDASFIELGLDSLSLTQCAQLLQKAVGAKITFRQLIEDMPTLGGLGEHLDATLPPDAFPAAAAAAPPPAPAPATASGSAPVYVPAPGPVYAPAPGPVYAPAPVSFSAPFPAAAVAGGAVHQLVAQQLQLMARQLELLGGAPMAAAAYVDPAALAAPPAPAAQASPPAAPPGTPTNGAAVTASAATAGPIPATTAPAAKAEEEPVKKPFGPGARIEKTGVALPENQQKAVEAFIGKYVARTPKSKAFTAENRHQLADPRVVTGFKPLWKEIVYPIVADRSEGSKIWDIDGNEYVDVTCGFGANFLGHRPPYVVAAVQDQLGKGFEIGPQHPLVADCARLVRELTGLERVAFCNTGSEAVLGATRLARTVTGKPLVVSFGGDYHGILDEVILRGTKAHRSIPGAPGILPSAVQNNLVLEYGSPEALKIIAERADEIAAVLVEPIQSRAPELQPREFLLELRKLTKDKEIALIFDEIITGFRLCPGGAQQYYGVKADLATYGKILGGGLPIGAIAGSPTYMDALDGGSWQFGDASVPEVGVTYFAGTFVRHPLALAACKAALTYVKEESPGLQQRINDLTTRLVERLSAFMKKSGAPFKLTHASSWFKLAYPDELPYGGLIFFWLRNKGLHIWDGRVAFLTVSHSEADVDFIARAFEETITEMQDAGLIPEPPGGRDKSAMPPAPGARLGKDQNGQPAWFVPDPDRAGKYLRYG